MLRGHREEKSVSAWKATGLVGGLLLLSGTYAQIGWRAQAGDACTGVTDNSISSPNHTHRVHIMNQYCAPGFGVGNNPYWVVVGDGVAKAGETESVTLAQEAEVIFKTWDYEPAVSWKDNDHVVVEIRHVATIAKSLHVIGNVHVSYKIAENLSEANYLREQREYEAQTLSEIKNHKATFVGDPEKDVEMLKKVMSDNLNNYRTFQAWVRENVE